MKRTALVTTSSILDEGIPLESRPISRFIEDGAFCAWLDLAPKKPEFKKAEIHWMTFNAADQCCNLVNSGEWQALPDRVQSVLLELRDYSTRLAAKSTPYGDYLQTAHWKRIQEAVKGSKTLCEGCRTNGHASLDIHHRSYLNLGLERFADLKLLCRECHQREHGK